MKIVSGLVVLWAALSLSGFAVCGQPQPRLVCAEYFDSIVVVEAKLIQMKYVGPNIQVDEMDGHVYEMRTAKVLRGKIGERFEIWEENSSGRAGFDWSVGQSYLLFLHDDMDRGWVLDGCGNSGPLSHAGNTLKQLHEISGTRGGMIQVAIGGSSFTSTVQGAEVRASNSKGSFSATTNKQGVAEIHVPPGNYKISVLSNDNVRLFELSYGGPQNVVIQNGGCAQIQFVPVRQN